MTKDLTKGNVFTNLLKFSLPFFLAYFLQTLYGLADVFIIGRFCGAEVTTAVSVGSQVMHMFTVMLIGLITGSTVMISQAFGAKKNDEVTLIIGNSIKVFLILSVFLCVLLILLVNSIIKILDVPVEAVQQTRNYLFVCFAGIPFIVAYNVISSIFRGLGDSKSPMIFVAVACFINIIIDFIFIGSLGLGALGAALGTVISQAFSVFFSVIYISKKGLGLKVKRSDFKLDKSVVKGVFGVGFPISVQDGFIQISFMVITAIANSRGVIIAASVGVVEKIIGIMFLVPSCMLASVSAISAQNAGAELHNRSKQTLYYGMLITTIIGTIFSIVTQFNSEFVVGLFTKDSDVIFFGGQYLRSYVFDCILAGFHFCFSGFFTAYKKSILSFIHNLISVILFRIPLAYLATIKFPETLYPMGWAAPIGSGVSAIVCLVFFIIFFQVKKVKKVEKVM